MKKILALVLALVMALSLVACGGSETPAATEAPKAEAPAAAPEAPAAEEGKKDFGGEKIVVSMWGDNSRKEMYDPIFAPFEEEYNIDVEIEVYTNAEYATKVLTEIAGGNGPDVVWLTERYYPMFVDAGVISEMNGLMTDPDYNYGDLSASLMGNYMLDGNLMSVPFSASGLAFFYNATLFKEAGLETPMELYQKGEWTVSKMLEAAKVLTNKDKGIKGLSLVQTVDPTNWPPMLNFFWAQGADLFTPDTSACIINDEAGIAALQLYKDLMFVDQCCVVPGEMVTFESGQLAMYPGNASESANYQNVDFEWDYICYPASDEGVMNNVVGVASYSIMNTTKNYDAAYEVVKYVTGHDVMEQLAVTFAPPRQSIKNSDAYLNITETMPSPEGRKAVFLDVFDGNTRTYPATVNWNEINEVGKRCFDMLYTGGVSAEDVAAKLDSEINALLK